MQQIKYFLFGWYLNLIRNKKWRRWVVVATLIYLISPFDIIPDFIPIAGWVDDGALALVLLDELFHPDRVKDTIPKSK
jgi:uncharacterized membrane protein YkvA (DUF1232 family)